MKAAAIEDVRERLDCAINSLAAMGAAPYEIQACREAQALASELLKARRVLVEEYEIFGKHSVDERHREAVNRREALAAKWAAEERET